MDARIRLYRLRNALRAAFGTGPTLTIVIRSQFELDEAAARFGHRPDVEFLLVAQDRQDLHLTGPLQASVVAHDMTHLHAGDDTRVTALGAATIHASGNATVTAKDHAFIRARGSSHVTLEGHATAITDPGVTVDARGTAQPIPSTSDTTMWIEQAPARPASKVQAALGIA